MDLKNYACDMDLLVQLGKRSAYLRHPLSLLKRYSSSKTYYVYIGAIHDILNRDFQYTVLYIGNDSLNCDSPMELTVWSFVRFQQTTSRPSNLPDFRAEFLYVVKNLRTFQVYYWLKVSSRSLQRFMHFVYVDYA